MKHFLISIVFIVLAGSINANAQNNKIRYLLIEVYADTGFTKLDTASHSIGIYSIKGNKKKAISALPHQIFSFKKTKRVEDILLAIGDKEFNVSIRMLQSEFAILKVYMNGDAVNNDTSLVIKNGDVIYKLSNCTNCHKIEIIPLSIITDSDGRPTTGYKVLNDYI